MNKTSKTVFYILIVLAVLAFLVYVTFNKNDNFSDSMALQTVETQQEDMQNVQQIEGVKITILEEGSGEVAKSGDTVSMNYTGTLSDGTVFDSNVDPKFNHVQPFVFTIGAGQVIKGWDVGVAGMKVGEKRTLEINPDYAYGSTGAGDTIPPNATLSFEVELLQIEG